MSMHIHDDFDDKVIFAYISTKINMSMGKISYEDIKYDGEVFTYNAEGDDLMPEVVTIKIGSKSIPTVATLQPKNYKPRYEMNKNRFLEKANAYPDVLSWTHHTRKDIREIREAVENITSSKSKNDKNFAHLDLRRYTTLLFSDMNHWYSALESKGFPKALRKLVTSTLDGELKIAIGHLRNLYEHSEKTKPFFKANKAVKPSRDTRSMTWFQQTYPSLDPWHFVVKDGEIIVGSIIIISKIESELEHIFNLLEDNTSMHVLIDEHEARY